MAMLNQFCAFHRIFKFSMIGLERSNGWHYCSKDSAIEMNVVGWCTVAWSKLQSKITMLADCCAFHGNWKFSMTRSQGRWLILGSVRKSHYGLAFGGMMQCTMKTITIWNGHAQSMLAFLFYPGRPRVLSFSEHLVIFFKNDAYILETIIHKLNFLLFVQNHKRNIWDEMNVIHTYHSEIDLSKRFSS